MEAELKSRLREAYWSLPEGCTFTPATDEELNEFERDCESIPEEFRWYFKECGGGVVGSEWVDGIEELRTNYARYQSEAEFLGLQGVFVIGHDGWGNPYGIHKKSGEILVADHDFGGIHKMATSFSEFLAKGLLHE